MQKIKAIKRAADIAQRALIKALPLLKAGVRERDFARALRKLILQFGGDGFSFLPIVASGLRSTMPHGRASKKRMKAGDTVVVDFGVKYKGFCSDLTRTYVIGKPTKKQKRIYAILKRAQSAAIKAAKVGALCSKIDKAARDIMVKSGFGKSFIHSTGHGIGQKVHEPPKISKGNKNVLKSGTVITIEPGIYIKGWGGVRIEDMVEVTKNGCRVLT